MWFTDRKNGAWTVSWPWQGLLLHGIEAGSCHGPPNADPSVSKSIAQQPRFFPLRKKRQGKKGKEKRKKDPSQRPCLTGPEEKEEGM